MFSGWRMEKQRMADFIDHVGIEWMKGVECVASDMNADFLAALNPDVHGSKGYMTSFT